MERIIAYKEKEAWQLYVRLYMKKAMALINTDTKEYHSSDRLLAQWNEKSSTGYVSEGRTKNRLWRILLHEDTRWS